MIIGRYRYFVDFYQWQYSVVNSIYYGDLNYEGYFKRNIKMSDENINSVISVIPVKNFQESLTWYKRLIGRVPDIVPMEGIVEWQVVGNAWIQVATDPDRAGNTTLVICVNDLETQCKTCSASNLPLSEIVEYPEIIKMAEIIDPEGNKISFVQDISNNSSN